MIMLNSASSNSLHTQDSSLISNIQDPRMQVKVSSPSSSRILYDIPCKVCQDHSSGKHYGIFACDGCAGFFKRSIRRNRQYVCKAKAEGTCIVDKTHRNQCRACRLAKCQEAGMNKEAVQHERGPRNSTLRRQMALFFKDPNDLIGPGGPHHTRIPPGMMPPLDLSISPQTSPPTPLISPHAFLMNPAHVSRFPLGLPVAPSTSLAPVVSPEAVCESAARLLFMNVKWAKSVPAFTTLPLADQLLLLEESWSELFVLGAAQFLIPLELGQLVHACGALNSEIDPTKTLTLLHEVKLFQDTLTRFAEMRVDPHEFACLRAIVLFKTSFDGPGATSSTSTVTSTTGNNSATSSSAGSSTSTNSSPVTSSSSQRKSLTSLPNVIALQDHTQFTLNKYILTTQPGQPLRFGKLLLLLPALRSVSSRTIVELFFKRTIGEIPIERIICDMYKTNEV